MKKKITDDGEIVELEAAPDQALPPFWKTPWNHNRDAESDRTGTECKDPSLTRQSEASDADINNILAKFMQTGQLMTNGKEPQYGFAPEEFDLQSTLIAGADVEAAWNDLPTAVRNILKTPKGLVDYVDHCLETGDLDPLRELGIAPPATPEPQPPTPETVSVGTLGNK